MQLTPRTQRRNELMERLENAPFDAFDLLAGVSELAEVAGIQAPPPGGLNRLIEPS